MAAKKKLLLLAHKLFSTMLSHLLLLPQSRRPTTTSARSSPVVIHRGATPPPPSSLADPRATLVVDVDAALLLTDDLFPYFMLVALEAGGLLRGLLMLLLIRPLLYFLGRGAAVRAMAAVAFCGLRAARFRAGRAVLPRWLAEDVAAEGLDAVRRAGGRAVFVSAMPRVMVDAFLGEYLGVDKDKVVAREMNVLWGFYTGIMQDDDTTEAVVATAGEGGCDDKAAASAPAPAVGFAGSLEFLRHPLARSCKEVFLVGSEEKRRWRPVAAADKYPMKPVVFHDGRLAFRPTASATAAMFAWLPLGAVLAAARLAVALTLPYRYSTPILAATGMSWRLKGARPALPAGGRGQLFVCNHRTLIDPVYVSVALDRPVRAVSYSLSRLSELISPIGRTVRLARDRARDGAAMARLLGAGHLVVVCPEGTTCREPYLLRFSPLFAELSDDVVPVAVAVETSMFYATTAGGLKCLDPLYYMANPRMCYTLQFLDKVDTSAVRSGDAPSTHVANLVQRRMGDALGYGCTMLTRKDKYLMLAGNDGSVRSTHGNSTSVTTAAARNDDTGTGRKNNSTT